MTPHKALQILRILQEALTNCIKHSDASKICIAANHNPANGETRLSVQDNGASFNLAAIKSGRGLANMKRRAADIGARLAIHADSTGTEVLITLE